MHLVDRFVDTGSFGADRVHQGGVEGALVLGPFSVQSEYIHSRVDSPTSNDPTFRGFYAYASYFITGEHRNYKKSAAAFDRIRPMRNSLGKNGGPGAWEIAVRYLMVDLNEGMISRGKLSDVTAGLNWYLNPNPRIMFNYVLSNLEDIGDSHAFMARFQVDF